MLLPSAQPALAPCWRCCCWQLATAHVRPSQTCAAAIVQWAHDISQQDPKNKMFGRDLRQSHSQSVVVMQVCILVFSKDLLAKYIVFCGSNLSGYLTHVVEWTGAIWPSSSFRSAAVIPRILQAEKVDSCRMNHSEYLLTLTLCTAQ